jgi:hypothetical protein
LHGARSAEVPQSSSAPAAASACTLALAGALALAACAPVATGPSPAGEAPRSAAAVAGGRVYRIDGARSRLRILVFRGGPLARLGHNHVLEARELAGEIRLSADGHAGSFELSFPVAALVLDEVAARAAAGADFASVPSAADIAGTRRNLLGPAVLEAAAYPRVRLSGAATLAGPAVLLGVDAEVRGRQVALTIPARIEAQGPSLAVSGATTLSQAALGLEPFSVYGGLLQVRDDLSVDFAIVALAPPPG